MLLSGAVELGMEVLKEFLLGFVITALCNKNFLPSLGIFLNPFQPLCVPWYQAGIQ